MNRHPKNPQLIVHNPAYRRAFQKLDEALEENATSSNAERIKSLRQPLFADVDELQKSRKLVIPKP
jgi:hypothetical protein